MSNTIPALVLRTDGTHEDVALDVEAGGSTLHALYRAIGKGCDNIEVIEFGGLPGGADMWLDGEGLFRQPVRNELAARLYCAAYGHPEVEAADVQLVNDVVITGSADDEGDTQGLDSITRDWILTTLGLQ